MTTDRTDLMESFEDPVLLEVRRMRDEFMCRNGGPPRKIAIGVREYARLLDELADVRGEVETVAGRPVQVVALMGMEVRMDPYLVGIKAE